MSAKSNDTKLTVAGVGSESALLHAILPAASAAKSGVILGNGDDAAVLRIGDKLVALTVDSITEDSDFKFAWSTPAQVGSKAMEISASDIVAVGGLPSAALCSLFVPKDFPVDVLQAVYKGMYDAAARLGISIIGGDTSVGGEKLTLSVTVLGLVDSEEHLCARAGAKVGDLVYVTGPLGGAHAGLRAFQARLDGFEAAKKAHADPRCRANLIQKINRHATSMIDISDGLASELHHLARQSGLGMLVYHDRIPLLPDVFDVAEQLSEDPYDYALFGGEDFQLLYTIGLEDRIHACGIEIGVVTNDHNVMLFRDGQMIDIVDRGFDHVRGTPDRKF